ncbi:MAG: DUF805 domain-containing protein [Pseudomonadota bacterium]
MKTPLPKPTVKWLLLSFRGRIGRKSFALGALLLVLVQFALFAWILSLGDESGRLELQGGSALFASLAIVGSWALAAWGLLAMAVKRLHDMDLPGVLAVLLIIPAIAFFTFLALAFMPGSRETNEHGPPPFPRD